MESRTIDLNDAERAVSSIDPDRLDGYQFRTLHSANLGRSIHLPIFPTESRRPVNLLLLANVPAHRLGPLELIRRQHGANTAEALKMMNKYEYGVAFALNEEDAQALATRLRVHLSIITFNANLLRGLISGMLIMRDAYRRHVLGHKDLGIKDPMLNSKQMAIALEFFLQIDVDIFCMKTCSFRGARPRSLDEGLFCAKDDPKPRYRMSACRRLFCSCCHPVYSWKAKPRWTVVNFATSPMHQFVNGYTTYLNCPATCSTSNLIYAMTCPCGRYDYIDSTEKTLALAMADHRENGNRIIHEKLTGSPLFRGSQLDPTEREKQRANKMRLYQHSARCPIALRSFLDCNPTYECFVPQRWNEALAENTRHFGNSLPEDPAVVSVLATAAVDHQRVAHHLDLVPLPPAAYAFSQRQRRAQRTFFEQLFSSPIGQLPYSELDLYQMAIIAVLPEDCSSLLRYIIETSLIVQAETNLNMICPLGGNPERRFGRPFPLEWCANLNHGSASTATPSSTDILS